jgi:hypothetical protein
MPRRKCPFCAEGLRQHQDTRTKGAPKRFDNIFRIVEMGATQTEEVGLFAGGVH